MEKVKFDLSAKTGAFKLLNATNGGPWYKRHSTDQFRSNFADYKAARIPYSRNHDSGVVSTYGGPFSHDITKIFRNFDADVNDPASYDFACTDEEILKCLDAGTKTFFRLGETIEHQVKKHSTIPPKDFQKWAEICEHIIMHYTEGWADGFELDMPYWEIWNEPNLDRDDAKDKKTWGGTKAEFCDFFETAAKHLKARFPHLKIGGPAMAGGIEWADGFLEEMQKREVPIDFFSWHIYCIEPQRMIERGNAIKEKLIRYGYGDVESILDEWNYCRGWTDEFVYSIEMIHGAKGAALTMACISEAQKADSIDMLMYYDTRPSVFNGVFDFYTARPLKGYYPLYWYGMLYDMETSVKCTESPENIYTLCGVDKNGKATAIVTYYSDNDSLPSKKIHVDFGKDGKYEVYRVDKDHNGEHTDTTSELTFDLPVHSLILIKEI